MNAEFDVDVCCRPMFWERYANAAMTPSDAPPSRNVRIESVGRRCGPAHERRNANGCEHRGTDREAHQVEPHRGRVVERVLHDRERDAVEERRGRDRELRESTRALPARIARGGHAEPGSARPAVGDRESAVLAERLRRHADARAGPGAACTRCGRPARRRVRRSRGRSPRPRSRRPRGPLRRSPRGSGRAPRRAAASPRPSGPAAARRSAASRAPTRG